MQNTTMDNIGSGGSDAKRHAPATLRNREAIFAFLLQELPKRGTVLEVASGSGEHAVFFAQKFPHLQWQPSDPDADALGSIAAYRAEYTGDNLNAPLMVDAANGEWPGCDTTAVLCINMVHISPWQASEGLFKGSASILSKGAPLILYGPYFEPGLEPAPSNCEFDASLKSRNPSWGIRDLTDMDALAARSGLCRTARTAMPANNLSLVYRRV